MHIYVIHPTLRVRARDMREAASSASRMEKDRYIQVRERATEMWYTARIITEIDSRLLTVHFSRYRGDFPWNWIF